MSFPYLNNEEIKLNGFFHGDNEVEIGKVKNHLKLLCMQYILIIVVFYFSRIQTRKKTVFEFNFGYYCRHFYIFTYLYNM